MIVVVYYRDTEYVNAHFLRGSHVQPTSFSSPSLALVPPAAVISGYPDSPPRNTSTNTNPTSISSPHYAGTVVSPRPTTISPPSSSTTIYNSTTDNDNTNDPDLLLAIQLQKEEDLAAAERQSSYNTGRDNRQTGGSIRSNNNMDPNNAYLSQFSETQLAAMRAQELEYNRRNRETGIGPGRTPNRPPAPIAPVAVVTNNRNSNSQSTPKSSMGCIIC